MIIPVKPVTRLTLIFWLIVVCQSHLFAQTSDVSLDNGDLEETLFENLLLEVELFLMKQPLQDSLAYELISDAKQLAAVEDWSGGQEVLKFIFDLFKTPVETQAEISGGEELYLNTAFTSQATTVPTNSYVQSSYFQIESGVDYSLQEYEGSFLETDSLWVSELQNPYFGIAFFQPIRFGGKQLDLQHRMRLDNQYFNYNVYSTLERKTQSRMQRLDVDAGYYHSRTLDDTDFMDARLGVLYGNLGNFRNRWYFSGNTRYKWQAGEDSLSNDIFSSSFNAYYEHAFSYAHSLQLSWSPAYYKEIATDGYGYFANQLSGFYRITERQNRFWEAGVETIYQRYSQSVYRSFTADGSISDVDESGYSDEGNQYFILAPKMTAEWAFHKNWGLKGQLNWKKKFDAQSDAINPSYNYFMVEALPKFYKDELKSFGVGAFWEKQTHQVKDPEELEWAQQNDFDSYGLVLESEFLDFNGVLLNLEYRISWQNFPNATTTWVDSYYSDRYVHSISLLGWIPLTKQLQIQLFANYDNDKSQDLEFNDNRSTLLNFGLLYRP